MNDLKIQSVSIDSLLPDPSNARKHSEKNLAAIKSSLEKFGQRRPLVVAGDNVVIAGNGTLEAAKRLGWSKIAVTRVPADWDYDTARAYALADNRTAELAAWDEAVLKDQLLELDAVGWDLADIGFETLQPPTNPMDEWKGMPEYEQDDRLSAFRTTVHFATEKDADDFFALLGRTKKSSFWYPEDDGLVGSNVGQQYVAEEE